MSDNNSSRIGAVLNGFNLDHIKAGNVLNIIKVLELTRNKYIVGVGLNLHSDKLGHKDLLKVEDLVLNEEQLRLISVFALGATYSVIQDGAVVSKKTISLASEIDNLIICPNFRCVSHHANSRFTSQIRYNGEARLKCHYCDNEYKLEEIKSYKI